MSDFAFRSLRSKTQQKLQLSGNPAIIGDESGNIFDPTIPGNVFVRIQYANGYGPRVSVRGPVNSSMQLTPGAPVELVYTSDKRLQVKGYDANLGVAYGAPILAANTPQLISSGFTGQQSIVTALVTPQTTPDLTVVVKAWIVTAGGVYTVFPGSPSGGLDLSSFVPASGNNCYVVVFIQDDYTTLIAKGSTARSIASISLGDADVQECLTAAPINAVPLVVIKLVGGQTTITNADIVHDLRQLINSDPGEYTASVSTTNNTTTTLFTLTIPASTTVAIHGYVTARRTGGSAGTAEDSAYYEPVVAVKNVAGTATITGSAGQAITPIEDQAGWDATFDVTGATVRCRILGATNNNINWKGRFKVMKVS